MIYVVGCNHRHQRLDEDALSAEMRGPEFADAQRAKDEQVRADFRALLRGIVTGLGIHAIAEEGYPGRIDIGEQVANDAGLRYLSLTLTIEMRRALRIPENYQDDPVETQRVWALFERHFADLVLAEREAFNVVVIVGSDHMWAVAQLLRAADRSVTVIDPGHA